jgi:RluA family pseudouridine synthase
MNIPIIFQDEDIVVVHKPANLLVHKFSESTDKVFLLQLVRDQVKQYLYPIHRLDRAVSGIVLFGLKPENVTMMQEYWHNEETIKEYVTLCRGQIPLEGVLEFPLSNDKGVIQEARTEFKVEKHFTDYSLVNVRIRTGRKHQIRRHFNRRMWNLIGDSTYGKGPINRMFREKYGLDQIFLHAKKLTIKHPVTNEVKVFDAELPENLMKILQELV